MLRLRNFILALIVVAVTGCAGIKVSPDTVLLDVSFSWKDTKRCTNISPEIVIANYPAETKSFKIKLKDRDAPNWNHGGGEYVNDGSGVVPAGALKSGYNGPCPPSGSHRYVFYVNAINEDGMTIGTGKSLIRFP